MTTLRFDDIETYRQQVQRIIINAEQRLCLFDTDLSHSNLDSIANTAALQALCQVTKNEASVRLLIRDERHFERDCARLQKVYQLFSHRLALRTWAAVFVAGAGIAWMYGAQLGGADARHWVGTAVALCVPVAAAVNWTLLQHVQQAGGDGAPDMLAPVLLGALLSALLTLPLSLPFAATPHDLGWLALLGVVQLAIPCLLAVRLARVLSAPGIALLALLEVVFGVLWVWLGSDEAPSAAVLGGGALVLGALAANEALALRRVAHAT